MPGSLNPYEKRQLEAIGLWKAQEPTVVDKSLGFVLQPVAWLVDKVVPAKAVRGALDLANVAGHWLADVGDVKRDGEVANIAELRAKSLKISDNLADEVHNWAIGVAVAEGAGTGVFGLLGAPIDVPVLLTLSLRTIHKIGLCYGYEGVSLEDREFVLGILAASGANSIEEKYAALTALRLIQVAIAKQTWKAMSAKALQSQLGKEFGIIAVRHLAKQLGINITKRKALAAVPGVGAFVGGSVNGWYLKDVGWAARRCFQERWLLHNKKLKAPKKPPTPRTDQGPEELQS